MRSLYRAWVTLATVILGHYKRFTIPFTLICCFSLSLSCTELSEFDTSQIRTTMNDSLLVSTESWDVEMVLMQEGKTRILIEGSYAINYQTPDRKYSKIEGPVYVQIFDEDGEVETEAWSKRAIYLENQAEFELFDSVRVHTADDGFLRSEYLKWSQQTDKISSPNFVIIITRTDSIAGRGFEGFTDLSEYTIIEPTGDFVVE